MPNRWVREGILDSERVNQLSWEAEVFYRRLINAVDDFGRFDGRPSIIKARLYALKPRVRDTDIPSWIAECVKAGLISVYNVNSKPYVVLHKLGEPRAKNSKYPPPPADIDVNEFADARTCEHMRADANICSQTRADANICEHMRPPYALRLTPNAYREDPPLPPADAGGGDGAPKTDSVSQDFQRFWEAYPRKSNKATAAKAWAKLKPDAELVDRILSAISWQKTQDQWVRDDGRFIPHPATWLNAKGWENEPVKIDPAHAKAPAASFAARKAEEADSVLRSAIGAGTGQIGARIGIPLAIEEAT